jgi:hypothetical protein
MRGAVKVAPASGAGNEDGRPRRTRATVCYATDIVGPLICFLRSRDLHPDRERSAVRAADDSAVLQGDGLAENEDVPRPSRGLLLGLRSGHAGRSLDWPCVGRPACRYWNCKSVRTDTDLRSLIEGQSLLAIRGFGIGAGSAKLPALFVGGCYFIVGFSDFVRLWGPAEQSTAFPISPVPDPQEIPRKTARDAVGITTRSASALRAADRFCMGRWDRREGGSSSPAESLRSERPRRLATGNTRRAGSRVM